jgi:hypothetical protein
MLPTVDVIIAGEVREWESVEYARDNLTAGRKKAIILLGRVLSEEPGMSVCARWIRTLIPELTTTWIPAGDPYWRPLMALLTAGQVVDGSSQSWVAWRDTSYRDTFKIGGPETTVTGIAT